jgi:molybdopterin molybdotransferase
VDTFSSSITYEQALASIVDQAKAVDQEYVSLVDGGRRVTATEVRAELPDPGYDQSLRDGFVIGKSDRSVGCGSSSYVIKGEIPAGRCDVTQVKPGESFRIMTGGMVPVGAERVVQQEDCICTGTSVEVPEDVLKRQPSFIQRRGAYIPRASSVVAQGTSLGPREIGLLATTGNHQLEVYRKVSVSFFCSGNELVAIDDTVAAGQKISSNRYLLNSLITCQQAVPVDFGVAQDNKKNIVDLLSEIGLSRTDIIISTGGMGPGKYDLLAELFEQMGGTVIYRSIAMRPGQSTLFGIMAGKLYFGLPGPPSAVAVLFNELVLPALRKMQGHSAYMNGDIKAVLDHDISFRKSRGVLIREGILFSRDQVNYVRQAGPREFSSCNIFLQEDISSYRKGDVVTVHKFAK